MYTLNSVESNHRDGPVCRISTNHFHITIRTYVGLYESGLFNLIEVRYHPDLVCIFFYYSC